MLVTLLGKAGHIIKDELTYDMLYMMFKTVNNDNKGAVKEEKEELVRLFKHCEADGIPAEEALMKHTARITSFTYTALFHFIRQGL